MAPAPRTNAEAAIKSCLRIGLVHSFAADLRPCRVYIQTPPGAPERIDALETRRPGARFKVHAGPARAHRAPAGAPDRWENPPSGPRDRAPAAIVHSPACVRPVRPRRPIDRPPRSP